MTDSAMTCNVCGSPYTLPEDEVVGNLPHVLLCGHIFCVPCLRALVSPQGVITCPDCQMGTKVDEEGVDGLQVDSRIIGLIYTAKMNSKRSCHGRHRWRGRRVGSLPSPPPAHPTQNAGTDQDLVKVLDEALCKATENLNTLDSLHQSVVQGIQTELKREKTRITKEIEDCIDKATGILHRRRGVLLSELNQVEQLFSTGREECRRVEARRKELFTVMQKARHIRQVPSLRTCCHLAQILETLQEPVDADSFDRSCLTLCSGLSCVLHVDSLTESVGNCLKIMDRKVNLASEPAQLDPSQPMRNGGSGKRRTGQGSSGLSASPEMAQEDLHTRTPVDPADGHNTDLLPSFIIEEIIEEADNGAERDGMEPKNREGQKVQRRNHKVLHDRTPGSHQKALQVWVVLSHLINPTHFYVRYMTERKAGVALARKINRFCSDARSHFVVRDQLSTGMMVFVRSKEEVWCRALVCELFQKGCLESVSQCPISEVARLQVFFQDYGFSKGLTISGDEDLSELNRCLRRADLIAQSDLHHWAPLAIRCSLKDIIPSDLVKGWSEEACQEMKHVIGSNAVEMQVFDQDGDTLLVDLKKVSTDNTKNTPLSLREHLVFMELARFYSPLAISGGSKPLQFYPPVHPRLNMELNAVVSHVNTPSDFYVQLVDSSDFLLLNTKLQNHYGSPGAESKLQIYCPVLAQACIALYNSKDWCRAQVTGFSGGQLVEVRYVDFGNKTTLPVTNLRQIKDEFFALPAMALWCSLADVVSLEHTWSDESIRVFRELTENKLVTVVATKHVSQYTAIPVCVCEVREHSSEHLASIGEILARKGLASLCKQVLVTEPPLLETVVWDPPLDESPLAAGEPVPLIPDPSEVQPNLTLPTSLKDLRVRVTHVTSPGNICVQLLQSDAQLKRIHDLLSREYLKSEPKEVNWKAEMTCAANVNGVWERGKVYSVSSGSLAEVLRCDFGNMVKLHTSNLRPLVPELIGSLLLECCLSDVRPAGGCSTWTATACEFISYYLTGALAIMTIKDPSVARPMPISLYCSNRAGQDVSIADFLISEGLALRERSVKAAAQRKPDPTLSEEISCPPEGILAGQDECVSTLEDIVREDGDQRSQQWCTSPPKHAPSPTSPPAVRTQAYLPPELPPHRLTRMSICAVSDNGVIYTMTPQTECEFERLQESLQQHIKTLPRQKSYNWKKVLGCAVMGSDMLWYRGQVQEVIGGHVKVRYVDQGIVENIPVCHVYPKVLCETVPQLCVPCQINGVIPVGTMWQWDAVALMKELLLGRTFDVQVVELPEDPRGLVTVEIMLDGMPLSRLMVYHQHATAVPGSSSLEDYVVKAPVPDLDDWDITIEGLEDPSAILGVYSNPKLPDKGKLFQVQIKHIRAPNEVFLSLLDTQECEGETLEEALERVNSDAASLAQLTDFPIEGPCLAQYRDGKYYRAKLLGFAELSPSVRLLVRHVDFGSDDILLPYELRCLPSSLLRFPCGAVCVWLAGFKPQCACVELERVSYRPEWSMRAMLEMIDLLHGCLSAMVTAVEPQLIVYLYNADGTLVHVPLVEKGLAEYD
ncbi:RING finger protein 17 [Electrophorus electricus]|uniref:RING finger protein 17 n=1 Tax=Electrophorus electricus TaxID=8005 RepID=UPI0015D045D1|nr:RING finger protein 17 [Electrophorus electricus]